MPEDSRNTLTDRAYTYPHLKPGSIHDSEHLVTIFNAKFFCDEAKFSLAELGQTRQFTSKDLDLYVERFQKKVLDCCKAVDY